MTTMPALEGLYQQIILDHYKHPHHAGLRDPFDAEVHHVNPTCGDEVTLRVKLSTDGSRIDDVSYAAAGCSISQASTSVMTDLVVGHPVEQALGTGEDFLALMQSRGSVEPDEERLEDAVAFAGVAQFPARVKCALLGWMAMRAAVAEATGDGGDAGVRPGSATPEVATSQLASSEAKRSDVAKPVVPTTQQSEGVA